MKKSFLIPNFKGQKESWTLAQIIGAIVLLSIFVVYGCSLHAQREAKKSQPTLESLQIKNDSLAMENAYLKEAMALKLVSLCDTLTPDEKIAQLKFQDYCEAALAEKLRQSNLLYEAKENAELAAYKQKEADDLDYYFVYQAKRLKAIRSLEKNNPASLMEYASAVFMEMDCNDELHYGETYRLEREVAPIRAYHIVDSIASAEHSRNLEKSSRAYAAAIAKIQKDYQAKLDALEQQYADKVAKKSDELNLIASTN